MEIRRQIMQKEIENSICSICNYTFVKMIIHHIDGDRTNNKKENLIAICNKCHLRIHHGINLNGRKLPIKVKDEIWNYRAILLKNRFNLPFELIEKKIKYEKWKLINFSLKVIIKSRCYFCLSKKNVKIIYPKYIKYLDFISDEEKDKIGIPFCDKCYRKFKRNM